MGMEGRVPLEEIRDRWSLDDLQKAQAVLDMRDEIALAVEGKPKEGEG